MIHITEVCQHKITCLRVVSATVTCETTVEVCMQCEEVVSEPKTDCI